MATLDNATHALIVRITHCGHVQFVAVETHEDVENTWATWRQIIELEDAIGGIKVERLTIDEARTLAAEYCRCERTKRMLRAAGYK